MKGTLYCIENTVNGKKYIGKTYNSLDTRWEEHLSDMQKERCFDRPLYRALNKYGVENFKTFSLGTYKEGSLEDAEVKTIVEHESFAGNNTGYNATLGGDGKRYLTFSEKDVLKTYARLQNAAATAKRYNCDSKTIRKILYKNNIESLWEPTTKQVRIVDSDLIFLSAKEVADYLIEQGLTSGKLENVMSSIQRQITGGRKTYLSMEFEYVFNEPL